MELHVAPVSHELRFLLCLERHHYHHLITTTTTTTTITAIHAHTHTLTHTHTNTHTHSHTLTTPHYHYRHHHEKPHAGVAVLARPWIDANTSLVGGFRAEIVSGHVRALPARIASVHSCVIFYSVHMRYSVGSFAECNRRIWTSLLQRAKASGCPWMSGSGFNCSATEARVLFARISVQTQIFRPALEIYRSGDETRGIDCLWLCSLSESCVTTM